MQKCVYLIWAIPQQNLSCWKISDTKDKYCVQKLACYCVQQDKNMYKRAPK